MSHFNIYSALQICDTDSDNDHDNENNSNDVKDNLKSFIQVN